MTPTAKSIAAWIREFVMPPNALPVKIVPLETGATITLFKKSNFLSQIMYAPKNTAEKTTDMQIIPGKINFW